MKLTEDLKKEIDDWSPYTLLYRYRRDPVGSPMMTGESGDYIIQKFGELRNRADFPSLSKKVGW